MAIRKVQGKSFNILHLNKVRANTTNRTPEGRRPSPRCLFLTLLTMRKMEGELSVQTESQKHMQISKVPNQKYRCAGLMDTASSAIQ